jgi:hypothetical protein
MPVELWRNFSFTENPDVTFRVTLLEVLDGSSQLQIIACPVLDPKTMLRSPFLPLL